MAGFISYPGQARSMDALNAVEMAAKAARNPRKALQYIRGRAALGGRVGVGLSSRGLLGTHVLSEEWDVLVILDACRVDALRIVANEYSFLHDIQRMCSVGGCSPEWMAATFSRKWADELRDTAYLSANGYADFIFEAEGDGEAFVGPAPTDYFHTGHWNLARKSDMGRVEHLWMHEREDDESVRGHEDGGTPPRYVTDRAIAVGREFDFDRLILHYQPPHRPYTANAIREGRELHGYESDPWTYLRNGGDRGVAFGAYLDHLRYVLDDVGLLLENLDAETVAISADHGDAFGEFGLGVYGHGVGSLHPHVRFVPWATTSAADTGSYTSEIKPKDTSDRDVDEALRTLGYIE